MLSENYNSATVRCHYHDRRSQAFAFLLTIGAKALVLQQQRLSLHHSLTVELLGAESPLSVSLSTITDEMQGFASSPAPSAHFSGLPFDETESRPPSYGYGYRDRDRDRDTERDTERDRDRDSFRSDITGLVDEAEARQRIVQQERLRSIRRKILEKNAITVYKRGRNHKMRLIEIIVQHEKKKETYIMWKSKMNTLKKVDVDHRTRVELLPHQKIEEGAHPIPHHQAKLHHHYHHHHHHNYNNHPPLHPGKLNDRNSPTFSSSSSLVNFPHNYNQKHAHNTSNSSMSVAGTSSQHSSLNLKHHGLTSPPQHRTSTPVSTSDIFEVSLLTEKLSIQQDGNTTLKVSTSNASLVSTTKLSPYQSQYSMPVPFLRLKNRSRSLDLQFLSHVELEAFLLVIQRYADLDITFDPNLLSLSTIQL